MTTAKEFKAILRERASRLSRPLAEPPKDLKRVVVFNVGRELYGLEIANVLEILRPENITYVPGAKQHIAGVTNLRGEIVTVVDLQSQLTGDARLGAEQPGEMIVGEIAGEKLGLLVAAIDGIYDIQESLIDPPLTTLEKLKAEHLIGEFKLGHRIVGLLNAAEILKTEGES